jgi:ATP-dependent DNA helicase RecQ
VLFYSWSDVIAYDRFADQAPEDAAERQRSQSRLMFRFAEAAGCRHQHLVGYFGERIDRCGSACDGCAGSVPLPTAKPARVRRRNEHVPIDDAAKSLAKDADPELLARLKELRKQLATEARVPAYVVFNDRTLLEMASVRPRTEDELLGVTGVGAAKLERYGRAFLELLASDRT